MPGSNTPPGGLSRQAAHSALSGTPAHKRYAPPRSTATQRAMARAAARRKQKRRRRTAVVILLMLAIVCAVVVPPYFGYDLVGSVLNGSLFGGTPPPASAGGLMAAASSSQPASSVSSQAPSSLPAGSLPPSSVSADTSSSAAASSSQPAAAPVTTVTVVFTAGEGGSLSMGGASGQSFRVSVAPGATCGGITAVAGIGYKLDTWASNYGGIASPGAETLYYTVPASVPPGSTVTVTAAFTLHLIKVPSLEGQNYDAITRGGYYRFDFDGYIVDWLLLVTHVQTTDHAPGTIISQDPPGGGYVGYNPAGNSLMVQVAIPPP